MYNPFNEIIIIKNINKTNNHFYNIYYKNYSFYLNNK